MSFDFVVALSVDWSLLVGEYRLADIFSVVDTARIVVPCDAKVDETLQL